MSRKRKEEVDLLEGFDFDAVLAGEIKGPEALVPSNATKPETNAGVSSAVDSRELGVRQALEISNSRRELGVRQALDAMPEKEQGVSQAFATALDKSLDSREFGVSSPLDISHLVGKEKTLVFFICEECRKIGNLETDFVSTDDLKIRLSLDSNGLRNLIHRVKGKGFVEVEALQLGRNGLRKFKIPRTIYQQFLSSPLDSRELGVSSPLAQALGTALETPPSSSRDLYSKESTTTPLAQVSDKIGSLDVGGLREYGITIETFKRAVQLHPGVSTEALSDLAYRLSELFKNPKERARIQNARGFVIKLVEQLASGVTPLDHIETQEERLMREYAQAAAKKRSDQQGYEESLLQAAFEKWDRETLDDEKFQAVPLAERAPAGAPRSAVFKEYFREKIWPEERAQLLRGEA